MMHNTPSAARVVCAGKVQAAEAGGCVLSWFSARENPPVLTWFPPFVYLSSLFSRGASRVSVGIDGHSHNHVHFFLPKKSLVFKTRKGYWYTCTLPCTQGDCCVGHPSLSATSLYFAVRCMANTFGFSFLIQRLNAV